MGANTQKRSGNDRYKPMAEINVTPFVDVMLVLLIVFMVTAPLLAVGVPVDLPQTTARSIGEDRKPLTVTVDAAGAVFLQEQPVELNTLVERLRAIGGVSPDTRIYVRGDRAIDYGRVMQVMGTINNAGFTRVALVTEPVTLRPGGAGG